MKIALQTLTALCLVAGVTSHLVMIYPSPRVGMWR